MTRSWPAASYLFSRAQRDCSTAIGAGRVYNYDYDLLNRLETTTYPADSGGVVRTETRTYDPAGNLLTFKNRAGATETFTYDTRNREINYSWSTGLPQARTLVYDDASQVTKCNTASSFINFVYLCRQHPQIAGGMDHLLWRR